MPKPPLCQSCIHNLGDGCTQSISYYPSRMICTSHKEKEQQKVIESCEFKVYSEVTPGKLLKYAYLP